jgi:GNAT superfamily N-acetyltransferase
MRSRCATRPAGPEDAPRLAVINVKAWRAAYQGLVPAPYLDALDVDSFGERWRERLTVPPRERICLVAELDGVVASYALGGEYRAQQDAAADEDTIRWGELHAIYTDPSLQGRGAGSAVQDALLAALLGRGFTTAALWVLRDNLPAITWYGNRGWRPDAATSIWSGAGAPLPEIRLVRGLV